MQRFKTILVVVDGQNISSQNAAIQQGIELTRENQARLTQLHGFEAPQSSTGPYHENISVAEVLEIITQRKTLALDELAAVIKTLGFEVDSRVLAGRGL